MITISFIDRANSIEHDFTYRNGIEAVNNISSDYNQFLYDNYNELILVLEKERENINSIFVKDGYENFIREKNISPYGITEIYLNKVSGVLFLNKFLENKNNYKIQKTKEFKDPDITYNVNYNNLDLKLISNTYESVIDVLVKVKDSEDSDSKWIDIGVCLKSKTNIPSGSDTSRIKRSSFVGVVSHVNPLFVLDFEDYPSSSKRFITFKNNPSTSTLYSLSYAELSKNTYEAGFYVVSINAITNKMRFTIVPIDLKEVFFKHYKQKDLIGSPVQIKSTK